MRFFSLIIVFCSSVFFIFILFFHPYFSIKHISFEGENFVSESSILSYTENLLGSSIVWWGYFGGVERYLLKAFPQFATVDVVIDYPDTIYVRLEEKPVMISFLSNQEALFMSEDGTLLNKDKKVNGYIQNLDEIMIVKGIPDVFFTGPKVEKTALKKIDTLVTLLSQHLSHLTIQVDCEGVALSESELFIRKITLLKDDHIPIYVGTMNKLSQKLLNLKNFYKYYKNTSKSIEYIDLRVSDKVIINYE